MTGFAGFLVRGTSGDAAFGGVRTALRDILSRNSRHQVATHDDGLFFLAYYDNGAWQPGRSLVGNGVEGWL